MLDQANRRESECFLLNLKAKSPRWKKAAFMILSSVYACHSSEKPSLLYVIVFYVQNFVVLIQVASIIWIRNVPIHEWNNYEKLWSILEYSRFDALCVETGLIQSCIYGTFAFCSSFVITLSILILFSVTKKTIPKNLAFVVSKLLILADIGNNSLFLLLLMTLKYSWLSRMPNEYNKKVSLDQGSFGIFMSLLSIVIIFFLCYCNTSFSYDCKHIKAKYSLNAKSTSSIKKVTILTNYLSLLLYSLISDNFLIYRAMLLILHSISASILCFYLPFYTIKGNFIHSIIHMFFVVSCFLNIIGYFVHSILFCLLGLILLFPISAVLWYYVMKYNLNRIKSTEIKTIDNLKMFELIIREKLIEPNPESIAETLKIFNDFSKQNTFSKSKLFAIWFSSFYFYTCSNESLALIKLNSKTITGSSLEEDYQEYILKIEINKAIIKLPEYQLINKLRKFEKLKKLDKKTLLSAFTFLRNINLRAPKEPNLEGLVFDFKKNLSKLMTLNSKLTIIFSDSIMLLNFYSTFVNFILGDRDKALGLNIRKDNLIKYQKFKDTRQTIVFSEENPLLLVDKTGKIIYSNIHIQKLFKVSSVYFSERYVHSIFPESLDFFSQKHLASFEEEILENNKYLDAQIGLIDSKSYWIESSVTILLISLSFPLFMITCKPLKYHRQSVVIDKNGIILERTKGFKKYIKENIEDVKGFNVEEILNLSIKDLKRNKTEKIMIDDKIVFAMYTKLSIYGCTLRVVSIYNDEESFSENLQEKEIKLFSENFDFSEKQNVYMENTSSSKINEETRLFESKPENEKSQSSTYSIAYMKKINQLGNQCTKSIRFFKIILILSVIITQITIVILSNMSFLIFAKLSINKQLSQRAINILGETKYLLTSLGDLSGMAYISYSLGSLSDIPLTISQFNQAYNKLYNLTYYYKQYSDIWSNCLDSEVLFSQRIPVIIIQNKTARYEYLTMYNYILKTLQIANLFYDEVINETYNINEYVLFLEYNAFGKASKYLHNELGNIMKCEQSKVEELNENKIMLIVLGFGILAVSGGMMLPFIFYTQKKMNLLWNQIKKTAVEDSIGFKKLCAERLKYYHKTHNYSVAKITQNQKARVLLFSYTYKYVWRILSLIILGSSYYIISNFYFYENFQFLLDKKPDIIYNLVTARVRVATLNFIDRNYLMHNLHLDIIGISPEYVPINPDYLSYHIETSEKLKYSMNQFALLKYGEIRTKKVFDLLFTEVQNTTNILRTGVYPAIFCNIIESYYIVLSRNPMIYPIIVVYLGNIAQIGKTLEVLIDEAQSWSEIIIMRYLNLYLSFALGFSVLMFMLYAAVYYPFLLTQGKKVKALEHIAEVVVVSNISNSNNSGGLNKGKK
ncbi:hypothetical protein SteCoe_8281 [Stentor coeruleus]|uniref:Uncharacterized protein n=1 Tax=Stentor coeruleus TaxID=5963 RepID=A0A1R2CKT4_9CILI|nr:hypothetical protein SteCoe_8281 [Stentor coeruleus]